MDKVLTKAGGVDRSRGSGVLIEGTCFGSSVKNWIPIEKVRTLNLETDSPSTSLEFLPHPEIGRCNQSRVLFKIS